MDDLENTTNKLSADARHTRRGTLIAAALTSTVNAFWVLATVFGALFITAPAVTPRCQLSFAEVAQARQLQTPGLATQDDVDLALRRVRQNHC
jgi:hypothetical protein